MTPGWFTRKFGIGDQGEDVRAVQLLLRAEPTGVFDDQTAARVRGYRRLCGLGASSIVDADLAKRLGELR